MFAPPRSTQRPAGRRVSSRKTESFAHQNQTKSVRCPYCPKNFYSLGGQARHIAQSECQVWEQARINAERIKRNLDTDLELAGLESRARKRVRFIDGDVSMIVEQTEEVPPAPQTTNPTPVEPADIASSPTPQEPQATDKSTQAPPRRALLSHDGGHTYVEPYLEQLAGSPINDYTAPPFDLSTYLKSTGTLSNLDNFNTLELLMTTGLTNKGRDRFLKSRVFEGRTPWKNCSQMLKDLDALPHGPEWRMNEIEIKEKNGRIRVEYLFGRNILDIVRGLLGDWAFNGHLRYRPERVWADEGRKKQIYSETWTGKWWWRMQMSLADRYATIVPLIIAADQTKLSTMCGGQQAYPVYLTIGNLPKLIRRKVNSRATVLLGYLPLDDFKDVANPEERSRLKHKLTHDAMAVLMEPLRTAAKEGVVMTCADGKQRRVYPIPAAFEGDWPEQCGMACADEGGCPVCEQAYDHRSDYPNLARMRNPNQTLAALRTYGKTKDPGDLATLRLKPWWPWWASIPNSNFHTSIMPDLLHQLYQGMVKSHAVKWSKRVLGEVLVDNCFKGMPEIVGLRHFKKGISSISQWTGRESKEMAKQLLPIVAGQTDAKSSFVALIRSILDFTFRAHQSRMTEDDIDRLERALSIIHTKKSILKTLGIYNPLEGLNRIPKLHMLTHYGFAIREMGTPDGYNTEAPEHLHIVYAKRGWRASNKVRPLPQMVTFIQRYEAIRIHRAYMDMYYGCREHKRVDSRVVYGDDEDAIEAVRLDGNDRTWESQGDVDESEDQMQDEEPYREDECMWIQGSGSSGQLEPDWSMAIKPATPNVTGNDIIKFCGAPDFEGETNEWLRQATASGLSPKLQPVSRRHTFNIWHKFYLHHRPLDFDPDQPPRRDTIRARPPSPTPEGSSRSAGFGTFDTVLFLSRPDEFGIHRYRAGRVKVIFTLPAHLSKSYPHPLVYIELFAPFPKALSESHCMYTTSVDQIRGKRRAIVIPLVWVVAACHLVPVFSQFPQHIPFEQQDLLSTGKDFFFNHYSSHFIFAMVEHWRTIKAITDEAEAAKLKASEAEATRTKAIKAKAARARLVKAKLDINAGDKALPNLNLFLSEGFGARFVQ